MRSPWRQRRVHQRADLAQWMIRRHHRFRVHVAAQVTSLMIPPAHPTASLCMPALVTGNQIDGGFYKGFFRSLLEPRFLLVLVGSSMIGPAPQVQPLTVCLGDRKAENVTGASPNGGTLAKGWNDGLQTNGRIVRVITFQSSLRWIGI